MNSAAFDSRSRSANAGDDCTDLNQVIARAERSISEIAGLSVGVQFALSPNATFVAVPLIQVEQIVLGLCAAARTLIAPGGRIVVETRGVNDAPVGASNGVIQPAEARARIIVRAEQLGHSPPLPERPDGTAPPADNTFSALEQLVRRHGGRLEFVPLSENDLACVAHLPYRAATDSSGRIPVFVSEPSGVILLIEDEPQVTARILRAFGYAVVTAHNERSALLQAQQHGPSIGLVISDLVLPGVSGKDLVRRLRQPCEHAQVLYISGYSPEQVGPLTDGARFLRKPFSAQELLGLVRELLPESVLAH
jgi:CheY-like chemotaxis protein